jgi:tetratricopeptide (TPR) repeat protein
MFFLITISLLALGCSPLQHHATIDQYNQFAIEAAELQLWNEAVFRWERVLEIDPQYAQAHNNLGVSYEALGKSDEAIDAYKRATELDPTNRFFRFNYRKCRLHVQRNARKQPDEEDDEIKEEEAPG